MVTVTVTAVVRVRIVRGGTAWGFGLNQDIVANFMRKKRCYGSIDFCVGTGRDLFAMLRRVGSLEDERKPRSRQFI